ncbi:hypothetical protein [Nocardia tengchongensis]
MVTLDALRAFIPGQVVATAEAFEAGLRAEFPNGAIVLRPMPAMLTTATTTTTSPARW